MDSPELIELKKQTRIFAGRKAIRDFIGLSTTLALLLLMMFMFWPDAFVWQLLPWWLWLPLPWFIAAFMVRAEYLREIGSAPSGWAQRSGPTGATSNELSRAPVESRALGAKIPAAAANIPMRFAMKTFDRITQSPEIMGGKACIRGRRVTVGMIVGEIGAGTSIEQLLIEFPYLEREDIMQALSYAAWRAEEREVVLADR